MKKKYIILLSTCLILLVGIQSKAQKTNNPFDVKQKTNLKSSDTKIPTSNLVEFTDIKANKNNSPAYEFKSIPFKIPIADKNLKNAQYEKNGLLMFVEGSPENAAIYSSRDNESIRNAAYSYLNTVGHSMQIKDVNNEFMSMKVWEDELNITHIKMQQYFQGIKVFGGQIILHGSNGSINVFNGTYFPTPNIDDFIPSYDELSAEKIALEDVATETTIGEIKNFGIDQLNYQLAISELVIYHYDRDINSEKLAWHITLRPNFIDRWEYFVDAKTGEIINKYNNTCADGPTTASATDLNGNNRIINTYQAGSYYYLLDATKPMFNAGLSNIPDNPVGAILTLDANNTHMDNITHVSSSNNTWNDPSSVSAHFNGNLTYDYYKNTHNRNSINGEGGTIISVVNCTNKQNQNMANAFWNGQAMFYGNGGGIFLPLAGGLDVAAHEMTHGVVQNTANLVYQNEPGAINEAMADISGAMVDRSNWTIGEEIIPSNSPYFPTGAMRDMANPHNGGTSFNDNGYQPMHVSEQYHGTDDEGGVHINSGIINHAFYLLATTISKDKAEKIFYRALANYMTQTSQFIDCRIAFEAAAKDIYGNNSTEHNAVINSFYNVGIGDAGSGGGGGSAPPGEISVNPGQDYILSYDVNPSDPNTLYISNTEGSDFQAISQTTLKRRPSIVDNGSVGVMITESNEMRTIEMTSPFTEDALSADLIWDNVAVSKDGSRVAAITTSVDSAIYVYDFGKAQWSKFHLYSPTFTDGVIVNNVLYADALEWDYTGQYIVYDAYNELENSSGQNIDYWDVGFIKVWDNSTNNWGDGKIFKLFTGLPEGVSIGNPSLSKNTPYILAFDYFDENTNEVKIMGANIETGDANIIFEQSILGFPNYSKLDDKLVFSALSNSSVEVVGVIGLAADKISPSGNASILIDVAKWPVWYSTGNRDLMDVEGNEALSTIFTNTFPNPANNRLNVTISGDISETYEISIYNIYGQLILEDNGKTNSNFTQLALDISSISNGTYVVNINVGGRSFNHKIVKVD